MTSLGLCKLLNTNRVRAFDFGAHGLISIFDDEHFSNSDYDILDPISRSDIRRVLISDKWKSSGSRVYIKNGANFVFPKPSHTLGCNPADKILESIKSDTFVAVTPTQALLASISLGEWSLEQAKKLVEYHPANLSKVWNWVINEKRDFVLREDIVMLKEIQRCGFEKRKAGEQNLYPFKKLVEV